MTASVVSFIIALWQFKVSKEALVEPLSSMNAGVILILERVTVGVSFSLHARFASLLRAIDFGFVDLVVLVMDLLLDLVFESLCVVGSGLKLVDE